MNNQIRKEVVPIKSILFSGCFAFTGSLSFAVLFQIKKRNLFFSAFGGFLSWILLASARAFLPFARFPSDLYSLSIPYFIAAAGAALYSEAMAVIRKTPVSIFLIVSLIPLVPGARIFQSMVQLIHSEYDKSLHAVLSTIVIAGSVSLNVLFTSFVFQMGRRILYYLPKKRLF